MKNQKQSSRSSRGVATRGFTIVELLIVIIVIAILATLVIIAYNGVQKKARNVSRIAAVKDWQKVITTYVTTYDKYPTNINIGVSGFSGVCLGADYPSDWDDDSSGDCYTTTTIKHPNSTWNTELQKITPTLPNFNKSAVDAGSGALARGIIVRADNNAVDGTAYWPYLLYWLEGTGQNCGISPVISSLGSTTSGAVNSGSIGGSTICHIKLSDPANL